ncbi:MAG TPA: glycoside hydrolase family 2 TIM barrel-domain containing protein, partial [Deinococcales bacterium]|nr:glycoside hydrolase family 2 TIM barrel-domain containing protein [Deinococcales bacterium]
MNGPGRRDLDLSAPFDPALGPGSWRVAPFHGLAWSWEQAPARDGNARWLPAEVPGSLAWDLLRAGEATDPYWELDSRRLEWVENRWWVYAREVSVPADFTGRLTLAFDGVDCGASAWLDGEEVGEWTSMFAPVRLDVTGRMRPGESHRLAVVVGPPPREWPQIGRTSGVRSFKPRMNYWWDFSTRLVNLGLWRPVRLECSGPARLEELWVQAAPDGAGALISVRAQADGTGPVALRARILDPEGREILRLETDATGPGELKVVGRLPEARLWQPNGLGQASLYTAEVTLLADGEPSDFERRRFGIRSVSLAQNPWPPAGAAPGARVPLPYTLVVNGRPLFMKGVNWTPPDLMYGRADLPERVRHLLTLARDSGVNLVRVNACGLIETPEFYEACDKLGLLVWQEFLQTSSGVDNIPPDDPDFLAVLEAEARAAVRLRRGHASLAVWCGGNELTDANRAPATLDSPNLAQLARVVAEEDGTRPFVPCSPSGPLYDLGDEDGLTRPADQHDVHGGWHYRGPTDTYTGLNNSHALLHSEFGTQGAVSP